MRKPSDISIDRALLLYLLQLAETAECSMVSDVKLQQLVFLSELQMLGKGLRGFHFEFMRFAYGAFSKDLDNDLLALRRKERLENFTPTDQGLAAVKIVEDSQKDTEHQEQILEIIQSVVTTYGPQDVGEVINSVENVEIGSAEKPEDKLAIRDISFHSIMLVPSRVEVTGECVFPPPVLARLNKALGF
jgi:hypothetical protein